MNDSSRQSLIDAYSPAEIANRVLNTGVSKGELSAGQTLALAVLAGAFIAVGAAFATLNLVGALAAAVLVFWTGVWAATGNATVRHICSIFEMPHVAIASESTCPSASLCGVESELPYWEDS